MNYNVPVYFIAKQGWVVNLFFMAFSLSILLMVVFNQMEPCCLQVCLNITCLYRINVDNKTVEIFTEMEVRIDAIISTTQIHCLR